MNPTRGAESHPKRPVPKVGIRVIVVVEDHNGAPGRTHILPQGNESPMKNMSTWQMRRPWWSDRVCLHHSAPVVITSLQISHRGIYSPRYTRLGGYSLARQSREVAVSRPAWASEEGCVVLLGERFCSRIHWSASHWRSRSASAS
jgi:hypothetical protein